ncbi:MAG: response regulator [Chthoniobacteraceae bacterium]|nr:response regulator [Chthoniobacteraceae bacterium]
MNAPRDAKPSSGNGELILMVDDEKSVLDMASIVFELSGYRVIAADNAMLAFEIYEKRRKDIDVVLLDLAMPIMDGIQLSHILVEIDPGVKIIVSSGQATPMKELELRRLGIQYFLPKPYNVTQLLTVVHNVIHPGETAA